jgi:RND family efflux transporter MFP subunit
VLRTIAVAAAMGVSPAAAQPAPVRDDGLKCLVEPQQSVVVSAPVHAVVEEVLVDRGDFVEKGQVLATLESSVEKATVAAARARADAEAELQATKARLRFEESRYKRSHELHESGVVSEIEEDERESARLVAEADFLRARENRELAEIDLRRAQALLGQRTIRSPIDGVVVRRILHPGEYADPLELMELAQIDPLRVEVFVPVSMLGRVQVGMRGSVTLEEPVGSVHEAEVTVVDRVVDAASGTFGVRLELPNADHLLPAGLKCQVRFPEGAAAEHRSGETPAPR